MTKKILATIFFLGLMLGMPAKAEAAAMIEVIDTEIQNVSLSVNESVLHITGANGMVLHGRGARDERESGRSRQTHRTQSAQRMLYRQGR